MTRGGAFGDLRPTVARSSIADEPIGPGRVGDVQRIDRVAGGVDDVGVDRAGGEA